MKWVGLTGGIATGKSTVGQVLQEQGFAVVDADQLARDAVKSGTEGYHAVVQAFGPEILTANNEIDRPKLGSIVFSDTEKLEVLEKIVHPYVKEFADRERKKLQDEGRDVAFYMIPLLFENGVAKDFDEVIVVHSHRDQQLTRIESRDGLKREEVEKRIGAQMPIQDKVVLADFVIENMGTVEDLREAVLKMIDERF